MSQDPVSAPSLVGIWRLTGSSMTDSSGKSLGAPYGPRGMGTATLTADGRMMAVLVDGRTTLPAGTPRMFVAYSGAYTFDGATLTTTVDASSIPAWVGTKQVRHARFESDRLILALPEMELNGVKTRTELAWEKVGPESS